MKRWFVAYSGVVNATGVFTAPRLQAPMEPQKGRMGLQARGGTRRAAEKMCLWRRIYMSGKILYNLHP